MFAQHARDIELVVHTAAQPSHDWAASDPHTDFTVNANGTLNLLQATREHAPDATFIFCSTNKVYGDRPNFLPLEEHETRLELPRDHRWYGGIDLEMPIDQPTHSLFGASKAAADLLVQEYGRYFDMPTVCFRGGCLTGPQHAGARLHGFLSYLMRCTVTGRAVLDLRLRRQAGARQHPRARRGRRLRRLPCAPRAPPRSTTSAAGATSNVSMIEAIALCEQISGRQLDYTLLDEARVGDHVVDLGPRRVQARLSAMAPDVRDRGRAAGHPRPQRRALAGRGGAHVVG